MSGERSGDYIIGAMNTILKALAVVVAVVAFAGLFWLAVLTVDAQRPCDFGPCEPAHSAP